VLLSFIAISVFSISHNLHFHVWVRRISIYFLGLQTRVDAVRPAIFSNEPAAASLAQIAEAAWCISIVDAESQIPKGRGAPTMLAFRGKSVCLTVVVRALRHVFGSDGSSGQSQQARELHH
jgi:hypothetical protein